VISFKNQTIIVVRAAQIVERGDTVLDWDNVTEHEISGCRVQPRVGEEVLFSGDGGSGAGRDAVISRWWLTLPSGADITSQDRVKWQGAVYEVDGTVQWWESPTRALAHGEAVLRRAEG
jgi:hypothetical protein